MARPLPIGQKKNFMKKWKIGHFMADKKTDKNAPKKWFFFEKKSFKKVNNIPYLSYKDIGISSKSRSQEIITAQALIKNGPFDKLSTGIKAIKRSF